MKDDQARSTLKPQTKSGNASRPKLKFTMAMAASCLAGATLTGCSKPDNARVCTNKDGVRVADRNCNTNSYHGGFGWFYYGSSFASRYPAVGERVDPKTGSYQRPTGVSKFAGVSERGGFGSSARTGSSGG